MPIEDFKKKELIRQQFRVYRPGDKFIETGLNGEVKTFVIQPKERVIAEGEETMIELTEYQDYFFVNRIVVREGDREQGIGSELYEEALKLAKAEGKKGIFSADYNRQSAESNRMWKRFQEAGRATKIKIDGNEYDAILC